jgi:SAM-dependent methyltransferase/uncharacterized protein YbaR (Trm112 family)
MLREEQFVNLLRCPLTKQPLVRAMDARSVDGRIGAAGLDVSRLINGAEGFLISKDGRTAYAVREGIFCLLPDMAMVMEHDAGLLRAPNGVTQSVQGFYNDVGWSVQSGDLFEDAARFEDLRPVAQEYIDSCHRRFARHFDREGEFILDVASGPVQYDAYLAYHEGYQARVCVDVSFVALRAAQERVKERGIYVLGDITALPFTDSSFDAAISLHTIYHVPFDRQPLAFKELHRVIKPGKRAAVVYSWGRHSVVRKALRILRAPALLFERLVIGVRFWPTSRRRGAAVQGAKSLYSHQAPARWFTDRTWPFEYRISCWRSIDVEAMRSLCKPLVAGRFLLHLVYAAEERWPERLGIIGQYPSIEIRKTK